MLGNAVTSALVVERPVHRSVCSRTSRSPNRARPDKMNIGSVAHPDIQICTLRCGFDRCSTFGKGQPYAISFGPPAPRATPAICTVGSVGNRGNRLKRSHVRTKAEIAQ